ncbi:MAG: SIS domain-containing protein [Candidatus Dormibacteraeota bacterium]|nr:SIS domain-containing protein [Candidatus Dormibacteraeota bacterium]MBV9524790.1 SIS domain-containing protein [Candidatus Dormibacteraeota bacterium]
MAIAGPLEHVAERIERTITAQQRVATACAGSIVAAAEVVSGAFRAGNRLLLCGNGGSAADSQHVAAEFVSRLYREQDRPALPALALTTDTSFLTAYSNDVGFAGVFARQVEAHGRPGDVLMVISTSGRSDNVLRAADAARRRSMRVIALLAADARLAREADVAIVVPVRDTQVAQECFLTVEHLLCELVERELFSPES